MQAVREITEWDSNSSRLNHDYLLDGDKIIAYRPAGSTEIRRVGAGLKIDRRGRKFLQLEPDPFEDFDPVPDSIFVVVQGSKGQTYVINTQDRSCTCPGFTYRGDCKHIKENL